MTPDELVDTIRKMVADTASPMTTHSESCWQWHLPCAAITATYMIEDLIDARGDRLN